MTWEFILGHMNYWLFIVLMLIGLYIVIAKGNLLKKIVGLNIFQVSVFMMYISIGKVIGGTAPILPYDNTGHVKYGLDVILQSSSSCVDIDSYRCWGGDNFSWIGFDC